MLTIHRFSDELRLRLDDLRQHAGQQAAEMQNILADAGMLRKMPQPEIGRRFSAAEDPGAIPSAEWAMDGSPVVIFDLSWRNHEQARAWAAEILNGRTTFAADGSQIYIEKETSLPLGAIQIGWFENPHRPGGDYVKDTEVRLFTPSDLLAGQAEPVRPETRIGEERFIAEAAKAKDFLLRHKGWNERGERMPVAFFDGTFLVSIALPQTSLQRTFVETMTDLMRVSEQARVPIVGYIDRSFSRDLLTMTNTAAERDAVPQLLYDAAVLRWLNMPWGSRSAFCFAKRKGLRDFVDAESGLSLVGFTYLQTVSDSVPVRLDIPAWVFDGGLLEEVVDVVRAECIVGVGYPYPLEAADQVSVISRSDKDLILQALAKAAANGDIGIRINRKQASKDRRR